MSKMGISVISSYRGGCNFETVGLSRTVVDDYFPGVTSKISGIGLTGIEKKIREIHKEAFESSETVLPIGGIYRYRKKSVKYQETMMLFSNYEFDEISSITNLINKNKFNKLLDMKILEILNEERNKAKDSYQPSELEPKTQLGELDFLYTDPNERRILLEQTYKLGNKLAIKLKSKLK